MSSWKSLSGAPLPGRVICHRDDIPVGGTLCLRLDDFPILVLRTGDGIRAFLNACPHQYLPLDHKGNRLLSADGLVIRCTSHGAGFSSATGEGVEGLGLGSSLESIPVTVDAGGNVVLGDDD
ncbi:Rieske (2Fe-2S) protein [Granulosicoccus sp. 3-233]|uniref:Rieske (2Fe-2S) protein n=1 Tax=Granulosicoccus sp. 3-233 TaxID=3417969 RepID=UPI003D32AA06